MQEHMYKSPIKDVSKPKQRLIEAWSAMRQRVIDKAVDEWHKCLHCCVSAEGCHFEHKLRHLKGIVNLNGFVHTLRFLSLTLWLLLAEQILCTCIITWHFAFLLYSNYIKKVVSSLYIGMFQIVEATFLPSKVKFGQHLAKLLRK